MGKSHIEAPMPLKAIQMEPQVSFPCS